MASLDKHLLDKTSAGKVVAWDLPTRLFKWALVFVVVDGWVSNAYGGSVPNWHRWNGYFALILVVFRLLWGVCGGSTARFNRFLASPARVFSYISLTFRGRTPPYLGHNPLGAWMVVALLVFVGLQGITGLYSGDEDRIVIDGPLANTVSEAMVATATRWHHMVFNGLELLVVLHVAANFYYQFFKRDSLIVAMVTGKKETALYADHSAAQSGSWQAAAGCFAAAIVLVFGAIWLLGGKVL